MLRKLPDWQKLSLREQIAQMIVVRASGHLYDHQIRYPSWEATQEQLQFWLQELNLGGVILLGGSSVELQVRSHQLQSWSKIPLLVAADLEQGVGQRFPGGTWFPPPMALGAIYQEAPERAQQYAQDLGRLIAEESLALGVNWLLAPVVDVNNNVENPVINIRAFGDRPEVVADLTAAFIAGAQHTAILTTAKHFPGHGDTNQDSHLELPTIAHDHQRLAAVELPPFVRAIASGVDSIMTAHLMIPAWDREQPATLSRKIVTEQLRHQLGFTGLVVTDALVMAGITKWATPEEVAVRAVAAGSDILLMPDNPEVAINAIAEAVAQGRLAVEQIQAALQRIWQAKQKIISHEVSSQSETELPVLFNNTAQHTAAAIIRESLEHSDVVLQTPFDPHLGNLIVVSDLLNTPYLELNSPTITIPQQFRLPRQIVEISNLDSVLANSHPVLLQLFIRGNPFLGGAGLTPQAQHIYHQLFDSNRIKGLAIFGSPYVLDWFRPWLTADFPWVFSYGQMPQAQAIALSTLFDKDVSKALSKNSNFGF